MANQNNDSVYMPFLHRYIQTSGLLNLERPFVKSDVVTVESNLRPFHSIK